MIGISVEFNHLAASSARGRVARPLVDLNPLESKGNYSATSNNMKLVHWPLMGGLSHLVRRGGDWAVDYGQCTNDIRSLLCGFNVPIKG